MFQLRVSGETDTLRQLRTWLEESDHGRHPIVIPQAQDVHSGLLMADVARASADDVLDHLADIEIGPDQVSFANAETIGPPPIGTRATSLIWADMMGMAQSNAKPAARYLVLMLVAGVIAGYGVLTINDTLIVGAMAVSPDTFPIVAACVGIVGGRWRLTYRSVVTLAVGLSATAIAAGVVGGIVRATSRLGSFSAPRRALPGW